MKVGKLFLTTTLLLTICSFAYGANEQLISSQDISGGVNEFDRESLIKDNQSTVLQNATIRELGKAKKRDGITEISDNTTASTVLALHSYYKLGDATKRLCMIEGTNMDVWNGTVWTADVFTDLTVSGDAEMFTAADYLWIVSPNMNTRAYNFTDLTESSNGNTNPPQSKSGLYHNGRILLWGNGSNRDYLWWSSVALDLTTAMTFDQASNAHKIDSGDNQDLVAVVEYGITGNAGLVAFKENSTYYINTLEADPADWTISRMFNEGCVARRTAVKVGSDIFFLSRDGETYKVRILSRTRYDTVNLGVLPLSNEVSTILADVSDAYVENACAIYYDDYYILAFPSSTTAYNDKIVVYDTQRKAWIEWTGWTPSQFATYIRSSVEELYFGNDAALAEVFRALDGDTDDGTAITYQEESKQWTLRSPHITKNWKEIDFEFTGLDDNYEADVYVKLDETDWEQLKNSAGGVMNLKEELPTLPIALPFDLETPGVKRQTYDLSQFGRSHGIKWKIVSDDSVGSSFERLGVYMTGWANKPTWEGEK